MLGAAIAPTARGPRPCMLRADGRHIRLTRSQSRQQHRARSHLQDAGLQVPKHLHLTLLPWKTTRRMPGGMGKLLLHSKPSALVWRDLVNFALGDEAAHGTDSLCSLLLLSSHCCFSQRRGSVCYWLARLSPPAHMAAT